MKLADIVKKAKAEISKKQPKRLNICTLFIIMMILVDQRVKEGYWFKISDVGNPLSHEMLLISIVLINLCLNLVYKLKRGWGNANYD